MVDFALVDGHCHTVYGGTPGVDEFRAWSSEGGYRSDGVDSADSPIGLAIRRWCAEPLGLEPGVPLDDYLRRREQLGPEEARRRLLTAAFLSDVLVDTGLSADGFVSAEEVGRSASARAHEVVRLEAVAERLVAQNPDLDPADFADALVEELGRATARAVAVKSIIAYRHGLDFEPSRPSPADVREAAKAWLAHGRPDRLTDPVLLRFLLWCGLDRGLPLQIHTGFGDRDLRFVRADPALLQPFVEAAEPSGVPIVLLHCYPYHRQAGWLAHVYPNVYVDMGLSLSYVGAEVASVLAEFLELAPYGKLLFSTDAYALPELYCVGATQFRHALDAVLRRWSRAGMIPSAAETERIAHLIGAGNARRLYGLGESDR